MTFENVNDIGMGMLLFQLVEGKFMMQQVSYKPSQTHNYYASGIIYNPQPISCSKKPHGNN